MAESTIDTEYVKQLEETVEVLTTHFDKDVRYGHWVDRHVDNDKKKTIIRSDLRVLGVVLAYVVHKDGRWMAYHLHRIDTKKFSGYEFGRLHGRRGYYESIDEAKTTALRAIR